MNVLVIGSGGREHALCRTLARTAQGPRPRVFCAPGNAGISRDAECVSIGATDISALADFAERERIDLTIPGGESTLAAGLATVLSHNVWSADWRVIITILGWLWIVGGAVRLGAPQFAASMGRSTLANPLTPKIGAAICLVLGALLCFFGYIH